MDRRSVVSLAAVVASGLSVSACMEPPRNDGRMFQRWAQAVSEIPTTDEEAVVRDQQRAQQTLARAADPAPAAPALPTITLTSEANGLRPAMSIAVVDPLELPNARDMGLRAAMTVADAVAPARMQPASLTAAGKSSAAPGPWFAQIAAFRSRAEAEAAWLKLKAANATLFASISPRFQTVDLGVKGTWVRLQTSGLPTQAAAAQVCRAAGVTDRWCAKGGPSA
jgi:cell division septation protein DedD